MILRHVSSKKFLLTLDFILWTPYRNLFILIALSTYTIREKLHIY